MAILNRTRLGARTAGVVVALGLGGWVSLQLWPHWIGLRERQPPKADTLPLAQPTTIPAPAPNGQTSLLGTDSSIAERPLQLVLVSTAPAYTLAESTATLGTDPRNPQTYAGGAILANGAQIVEIKADGIVLAFNGRRATLNVDREAASRVALNAAITEQHAAEGLRIQTPVLVEGRPGSPSSVGGQSSAGRGQIDATSRKDLSEILRPQPVYESNRFAGLRILPGSSPGRLVELGVEPGDVIRSVDGRLIDSDAAWAEIENALFSGASIVAGIERNGSLLIISLDGSRLAGDQPIG